MTKIENTVSMKEGAKIYAQLKRNSRLRVWIRYYIRGVVLKPGDRDKMMWSDEEINLMI